MKGRGDRPARVAERIREELSVLLQRKVNDPGLSSVTITDVTVTPDLKISHVNYTALVEPSGRKAVAQRCAGRRVSCAGRWGRRWDCAALPSSTFTTTTRTTGGPASTRS
jgi:ribosome-binding factor A